MYDMTFMICGIISLLVGGIVVMNIQLASFNERVREVGTRKAVGATPAQIFFQFLTESVLVSVFGGFLGIFVGKFFTARHLAAHAQRRRHHRRHAVMNALIFAAGTGLVFGMYPAIRASRLNPIEALRTDEEVQRATMQIGESVRTVLRRSQRASAALVASRSSASSSARWRWSWSCRCSTACRASVLARASTTSAWTACSSLSQREPVDRVEQAKAHLSRGLRVEDVKLRSTDADYITLDVAGRGDARRRHRRHASRAASTSTASRRTTPTIKNRNDLRRALPRRARRRGVDAGLQSSASSSKSSSSAAKKRSASRSTSADAASPSSASAPKFNMQFVNDDDMRKETGGVYIPLTVYRDMFGRANAISYMLAKATTPEKSIDAEDEAAARFRQAHNGIGDVRIENVGKEILKERGNIDVILRNWRIVFFAIAGVSLLIGGVGIFSVLKISISERLFEIGLRKSIGAERRRDLHAVPDRIDHALRRRRRRRRSASASSS